MPEVVTKEQIRDLILAEKIKPSDLFGAEALTEDPVVKGYVDAEKKAATTGEYAHRKRTEEGFDKTRKELEEKLAEREKEVNTLKIEAAKLKVKPLFDKQKAERKLDERQVKFIEQRLDKFTPEKVETLEADFNKHLDGLVDEFDKVAEVFGAKQAPSEGDKKNPGAGPDLKPAPAGGDDKYLDPASNPFIKTTN